MEQVTEQPKVNKWLAQRAEMYAAYAQHQPDSAERVQMKFEYPDAGWIDTYFSKPGMDEPSMLSFSYIGEPFVDYIAWLEHIAQMHDSHSQIPSIMINDVDSFIGRRVILSYEPIALYTGWDSFAPYPTDCGIFSVYDETPEKLIFHAYCDTALFVKDRYNELRNYIDECEKKPEFYEDWIDHAAYDYTEGNESDEEIRHIYLGKLQSSKLNKYVSRKDMTSDEILAFKRACDKELTRMKCSKEFIRKSVYEIPDWGIREYASCHTPKSLAELLTK